ncbi:MAG TPA: AGE family epimerase/isomerase [Spirochaetota bacterium]
MDINKDTLVSFGSDLEKELLNDILPFWINLIDRENGGFYGEVSMEGVVNPKARKGGILMSRILWTFSRAYLVYRDEKYREAAEHVFRFISDKMWDEQFDGVYYAVNYQGAPLDIKKHLYCESFAIYGLSEYNRATQDEKALGMAVRIFERMEESSSLTAFGGYLDICDRDWTMYPDLLRSRFFHPKTMNTHLHILEGLTNLYRVWKDERLARRLKAVIEIFLSTIIDRDNAHFKLFFDDAWTSKSDVISFGHDIEGSWLLLEAADVLGDTDIISRVKDMSLRMAEAVLNEGLDDDGAVLYEGVPGKITSDIKEWWPQAENVVGMFNAYQISGDEKYLRSSIRSWEFIRDYMRDRVHGEWHGHLNRDRSVRPGNLVSFWKCPYHNGRMVLEIKDRLGKILSGK